MSQFDHSSSNRGEVSESAFEYMIGELMNVLPLSHAAQEGSGGGSPGSPVEDEKIFEKLDDIGYSVGYRLIEKLSSQSKFIGSDHLEIVKFICKEFWEIVFKKKIDKLQTNHKGVFVLSDLKFKWVEKYSSEDIACIQLAIKLLNFPCGIIRGALANLGLPSTVTAEFNTLPACTFNVRVKI